MNSDLLHILHDVVLNAPNGTPAKVVAEMVGKSYVTFLNELNPGNEDHKLGAALIVPIMRATGSVEPLHHLAQLFGGVFIKLPRERRSLKESHRAAIKAVAEFGDVMKRFDHALDEESEGGVEMTETEYLALEKEIHESQTAMTAFRESARAEVEKRLGRKIGGRS